MGGHKFRELEGVKGRKDAYAFDPQLLKVDPNYNVRDLTTPEARAKLDELKEDIRVNGIRVPLEIRFDGQAVYVTAGHRRHKVVMELIEEGEPIETVLCIHEAKGTNDAERTLNLVLSNSGEPLTTLEYGEVVRRLLGYGWDEANIAKRLNKSVATIGNYLKSVAMPADIQDDVKQGKVSATVARSAIKEHGEEFARKLIQENLEENRRIKGKDSRATPKGIKKAAERAKPKAVEPKPEAPAETDSFRAGETAAQPDTAASAVAGTGDGLDSRVTPSNSEPEPAPAPISPGFFINGFLHDIEPIAHAFEHTNWDEVADDQWLTIQIIGADAKRFSAAWNKATGETS